MKYDIEILIIDNDETVLYLHRLYLEEKFNASQIISFTDAAEALGYLQQQQLLQTKRYIIFLDINMPMMDGWECLDEMSKAAIYKNIHVFMVSSSINPTDAANTEKYSQVIGYVEKPISDVLINKLHSIPELQYLF